MLGIPLIWRVRPGGQHIFFIANDMALLAFPSVAVQHSLPCAGRVKSDIELLASLAKRRGQRMAVSVTSLTPASRTPWPMLTEPMVLVALGAAVLAFVLPLISSAMFHPKLATALWILADQRLKVRALAAAEATTVGNPFRCCFELLSAGLAMANNNKSSAAGTLRTMWRTVLLGAAARQKRCFAMLAGVGVLTLTFLRTVAARKPLPFAHSQAGVASFWRSPS